MKTYPIELRQKIIDAVDQQLSTYEEIAEMFGSPEIPVVESIYCGFIQAHSAHSLRDREINAETDDQD